MTEPTLGAPALSEPPTAADYRSILHDHGRLAAWAVLAGFEQPVLQRRIAELLRIGRHDLGLARLVEGHLDAVSILAEAGRAATPGAVYAVWASGGPADTTRLAGTDRDRLSGRKPFCSGGGIVDRALIWVGADQALAEVDLSGGDAGLRWSDELWRVDAMAGVRTLTAIFDALPVVAIISGDGPGGYFDRPGFARGALCPAACWAGGALALVDQARGLARDEPLALAHIGRMQAAAFGMESALRAPMTDATTRWAGLPGPWAQALAVRHLVERSVTQIIDEFGRLLGPRPLVNEPAVARRIQELHIYIRQCHGDRDLAELGRHCLTGSARG